MRGRPGLDRVGKQAETRLSRNREGFEGKVQVPDDRVVDALDAGGVDPDVVGSPSDSELLAAGGQLPDQIGQGPLVGVAASLGA